MSAEAVHENRKKEKKRTDAVQSVDFRADRMHIIRVAVNRRFDAALALLQHRKKNTITLKPRESKRSQSTGHRNNKITK